MKASITISINEMEIQDLGQIKNHLNKTIKEFLHGQDNVQANVVVRVQPLIIEYDERHNPK